MKVSIITATYNSRHLLHQVSTSIKTQSLVDLEWIIIDGGSTDGTLDVLKSDIGVSLWISEIDKGIYDALNKGIRLAKGDIIGFLHSDDLFFGQDTLKKIVRKFQMKDGTRSTASVVYGDLIFVDSNNTNHILRYWKSQPFKRELLNRGWMPPHPTVFMRREVYEKHGLFNINLKCSADYDYMLRVFKDPDLKFVYLPEVITRMRMGGTSTSGLSNIVNKKKEDYWVLKHNQMPHPFRTLLAKNFYKIPQLFARNVKILSLGNSRD